MVVFDQEWSRLSYDTMKTEKNPAAAIFRSVCGTQVEASPCSISILSSLDNVLVSVGPVFATRVNADLGRIKHVECSN